MKLKNIYMAGLCAFILMLVFCSTVSARTEIYDGDIMEGDGYQLNNYVIEITDVFVDANTASYYVYKRDSLIDQDLLDINETGEFDFEDEGEVQIRLKSVHSGSILPRATVEITMSNYNSGDLYINEVIDGGHSEATFAGDPDLEITKDVDKSEINVGDSITVTVKAKNTGDDVAQNVIFTDPKQEHFILEETTYEISGNVPEIDYEKSTPETLVYIYTLKATEAGTFELKPVTASYTNSADQSYTATSNTPPITVLEGNKQNASVKVSMSMSSLSVERNGEITSTIVLKNTGNAAAQAVRLDIQVPEGLEYTGGDEGIEVVGGSPRIYLDTLQPNNDKEVSYTLKAKEVGTYSINSELSYEYNNGVDASNLEENSKLESSSISVTKGKYDFLFEQPVYVYVVPVLILAILGIHIYRKHREYKY